MINLADYLVKLIDLEENEIIIQTIVAEISQIFFS